MNGSDLLGEIAPALVAAQKALKNPRKDARGQVRGNPSYKYLSLPALLEAVRDVFKEHGLAVLQEVSDAERGVGVTTRILHTSGQWIDVGPLALPATGGPQDFGSSITYARRYSLAAAVGLAADEDDDASAAQRAAQTPPSGRAGSGSHTAIPSAAGMAPEPVATSTGGGEAGEGPSTGGPTHDRCGGVFLPSETRAGFVSCSKCSTLKKAA